MKPEERFARAISGIARRVAKLQSAEICCGGLTREQFETLRAIEGAGQPSMGALSAAMRVDLSTMSRNVSVLERERYVARARAAEDGRQVTVALTPRGRAALETLRCDEQDVMAKIYRRLPVAGRAPIVDALEAVQAALDSGVELVEAGCCADDATTTAPRAEPGRRG